MTDVLTGLLADLAAESEQLRAAVAGLSEERWRTPTPAEGWDVATQIAHLAWTDECAVIAATDKPAWDRLVEQAIADMDGFVDKGALEGGAVPSAELLARWDGSREALARALRDLPPGEKLPWFGPPMSAASMATARFMETWAHALDVYEALGIDVRPTDRVRHVCHLGVRTRGFSYVTNGLTPPASEIRVELTAPGGETWTWGPEDADQRVTGSAWDFARLVTQRVHRDDTDLVAEGDDAAQWLTIAQAFAGPPGKGRDRA
jgi:uncharacterized protein (TIGR03084 family)